MTFQLMLLVTLLDTDDLGSDFLAFGDIIRMRQHFLRLFQRKFHDTNCMHVDYAQFR